jgi:hypothetical protein
VSLWTRPVEAAAQCEPGFGDGFLKVGAIPVALLSLPPTIANGIYATKGERPSPAWLVMGYLSSVVGLAYSTVAIVSATDSCLQEGFLPLAVLMTTLTGLDLGFTIWAHTQPSVATQSTTADLTSLTPEPNGSWFLGLALTGRAF